MVKQDKKRFVYIKDHERTVTGFKTYDDAKSTFDKLSALKDAIGEDATIRVRICLDRRMDVFDVVVKVRTEVKESKPTPADPHVPGHGMVG